ncbi:hypothetical protein JCM9492_08370 [Aquifex pyrophilus]
MRKFLFLFLLILLSCAPKVKKCPPGDYVLSLMEKPPERVKLYGYAKALFIRFPFLVSKEGKKEVVKTPENRLTFTDSLFCMNDFCFELPFTPSQVIYGYFPGRYKLVMCSEYGVYESEKGLKIYVKNRRIEKVVYGNVEILYGEKAPAGYFKEIDVSLRDGVIKIYVEGIML